MSSVNKVILVGNLGKDPETSFSPSGLQVTKFSIATSENFKKGENWEEKTEWHNIVMFNRPAQYAADNLKKGMQVYIEGKLQTSSWDDPNGNKRYKTEIIAMNSKILSKRNAQDGNYSQNGQNNQNKQNNYNNTPQNNYNNNAPSSQNGPEDDLPF